LFDGTNIYSLTPLPTKKRVTVNVRGKAHDISTVDSRLIGSDVGDTHPLMNIIFRKVLESTGMKRIFDDFYDLKHPLALEDDRVARAVQIFPGVISEVSQRYLAGKPTFLLSLDPTHKVVSQDSILSLISGVDQRTICRQLRGKRVTTVYNYKTYGVEDVAFDKNPNSTFKRTNRKTGEEETISFVKYYQETGQKVTDMKQPLLVSTGRQREKIYLLPEFCVHASVPAVAKAKLPQITSVKPAARVARINGLVSLINNVAQQKSVASLARYGMKVDSKLVPVKSTVLAAPPIVFAPKNEKRLGSEWRSDASNVKYTHVTTKKKIQALLVCDDRDLGFVKEYWAYIKKQLTSLVAPLEFAEDLLFPFGAKHDRSPWSVILAEAAKLLPATLDPKSVLLVPFLPTDKKKSTAEYDDYREFALSHGFVGQAIDASPGSIDRKLDKRNHSSIIMNIARQIVNKFGTLSWWSVPSATVPKQANKQFLFIGIDIFHAPPTLVEKEKQMIWQKRSIAAYTAKLSIGATTLHYCDTEVRDAGAEISGQRTKGARPSKDVEEAGSSLVRQKGQDTEDAPLGAFVANALEHWKQYIKATSLVVIVYRDGVADSQLDQVDEAEVAQLKLVIPAEAHLIYSVVQKRVHNRFVMSDAGRFGNCPVGTVVEDLARVDPKGRYNFFMVPCATNLSTNKPVHYTITYDSKPDVITHPEFHALTFAQHHTYQNWAGTVKVPDVCQYAHKLAYTLGETGVASPLVHRDLKETMFYL
jgi:aubergine-like protein